MINVRSFHIYQFGLFFYRDGITSSDCTTILKTLICTPESWTSRKWQELRSVQQLAASFSTSSLLWNGETVSGTKTLASSLTSSCKRSSQQLSPRLFARPWRTCRGQIKMSSCAQTFDSRESPTTSSAVAMSASLTSRAGERQKLRVQTRRQTRKHQLLLHRQKQLNASSSAASWFSQSIYNLI